MPSADDEVGNPIPIGEHRRGQIVQVREPGRDFADRAGRVGVKGHAGEQLDQEESQGVDVGGGAVRAAPGQARANLRRKVRVARGSIEIRRAPIRHDELVIAPDQVVLRFHISMRDARPVRGANSRARLSEIAEGSNWRQAGAYHLAERRPIERHDKERHVAYAAVILDRDDPGMELPVAEHHLVAKSTSLEIGRLRGENLDRVSPPLLIGGFVDRAGHAAAKPLHQRVPCLRSDERVTRSDRGLCHGR